MKTSYSIARVSTARKWLFCGILILLIWGIVFAVTSSLGRPLGHAAWWGIGIAVFMVATFHFFDRSRHVRFEIEEGHLRISGDFFGRRFPFAKLRLEKATVMDLAQEADFRPRWKTMGTSMPGYDAGEFSLRNGKAAFVFLSDRSRVLCIPLVDGHILLLSCKEAEELLSNLIQEKERS